jgi:hypothetical protein
MVLIWSSTDLPMAPRSKGHRFKGGEFMLAPYGSRDWTWLDCRRSPAKPNCQSLESDPTVAGNGYDTQCCSHQFHVRQLLLSPGAVGRQTSGASGFLVEETCGGSWCLWKFYRSKAIINHPYTMVNQKPELSREITVNWSHFVSGIIPRFVTRYAPRIWVPSGSLALSYGIDGPFIDDKHDDLPFLGKLTSCGKSPSL